LRSNRSPDKRLAARYTSVKPFADGLAAVAIVPRGARAKKWGFIDETGRIVIPMRYEVVTSFHDGLAAVGKFYGRGGNLKWGIVEKLGPQVTPYVNYEAVKILGEGLAAVGYAVPGQPGLRWNLINRENTTIFHGFDNIGCLVNGRGDVSYTDGNITHTGYINKVGDFFAEKK
jgi:hypothetical protein